MIEDRDHYLLAGWIVNELGLTGVELIIYAIMYNSCQDGRSLHKLNLKLLTSITGVNRVEIDRILKSFERRKLIQEVKVEHSKDKRYRTL